ncbi:MAG: lysis system i-spanin subunit Rz [Oxalobacteraceae bacterium]|nr:lysis system i-spanin subunit Rz [Oxalobacteraceae bacterium]
MNRLLAELGIGFAIGVAAVLGGYHLGDVAATNRDKAQALDVERIASKKLADANAKVRATEKKSTQDLATISATYQKGLSDVISTHKDLVARIRSGAVRLSVPARADPAGAAGIPAAATGGRDGGARCGLSDAAAEFLAGLASEADGIARQLSACQAVLNADRAACNAH